nr:LytTR family DNA-binding domain-containing protein [uncultured Draconibacterium sp.]
MKVLIIEDEKAAFENLKSMLKVYDSGIEIAGWVTSVKDAISWFRHNSVPDLIFLDIYLSDGLSFELFKQIDLKTPVVFTTAYHQYAIQAFEANSVDYLLKPFKQERLNQSLDKFKEFHSPFDNQLLHKLKQILGNNTIENSNYKERFLVKSRNKLFAIDTNEIAYFHRDELVFLTTFDKNKFIVEYSLDELERILQPRQFFRANRKLIVNIKAIRSTDVYSKSKLRIKLNPEFYEDIIVSQEKSSQFKRWLDFD